MVRYVYPGQNPSSPDTSEDESSTTPSRHSKIFDGWRDALSKRQALERSMTQSSGTHPKSGQIRLLYVKHVARSAGWHRRTPIRCSRHVFNLQDTPPFRALSYTCAPAYWKNDVQKNIVLEEPVERLEDSNAHVVCDGKPMPIYTNLDQALRQLRFYLQRDMWLWVDCLCIDQEDANERAMQVQQMHRIYSSAKEVLVWLGPSLGLRQDVLGFVREFCNVASRLLDPETNLLQQRYLDTAILNTKSFDVLEIDDFEDKLVDLMIFFKLCRYPSRIWCLQEAILAKEAIILGWDRMEVFNCLTYLVDYFSKAGWFPWLDEMLNEKQLYIEGQPWRAWEGLRSLSLFDSTHSAFKPVFWALHGSSPKVEADRMAKALFDSVELLYHSRSLCCTDPRDQIYAVLGVAARLHADLPERLVVVDYSISVETLYTNLQRKLLEGTQSLDLLSYIGLSLHASDESCPSWVPDFRWKEPLYACAETFVHAQDEVLPLLEATSPCLWFEGDILCCNGFELDEISHNYRQPDGSRNRNHATWIRPHRAAMQALLDMPNTDCVSKLGVLLKTTTLDAPDLAVDPEAEFYLAIYLILNDIFKGTAEAQSALDRCLVLQTNVETWGLSENLLSQIKDLLIEIEQSLNLSDSLSEVSTTTNHFQRKYDFQISRFVAIAKRTSNNRVLARTKKGWLASTQNPVEEGDKVFVLAGCRTPFVLREISNDEGAGCYIFDGDVFICDEQARVKEEMERLKESVGVVKIV